MRRAVCLARVATATSSAQASVHLRTIFKRSFSFEEKLSRAIVVTVPFEPRYWSAPFSTSEIPQQRIYIGVTEVSGRVDLPICADSRTVVGGWMGRLQCKDFRGEERASRTGSSAGRPLAARCKACGSTSPTRRPHGMPLRVEVRGSPLYLQRLSIDRTASLLRASRRRACGPGSSASRSVQPGTQAGGPVLIHQLGAGSDTPQEVDELSVWKKLQDRVRDSFIDFRAFAVVTRPALRASEATGARWGVRLLSPAARPHPLIPQGRLFVGRRTASTARPFPPHHWLRPLPPPHLVVSGAKTPSSASIALLADSRTTAGSTNCCLSSPPQPWVRSMHRNWLHPLSPRN